MFKIGAVNTFKRIKIECEAKARAKLGSCSSYPRPRRARSQSYHRGDRIRTGPAAVGVSPSGAVAVPEADVADTAVVAVAAAVASDVVAEAVAAVDFASASSSGP